MFVSAWIDQHLHFGEKTTNRVESQHANIKRHLKGNNKSTLDNFIVVIDDLIRFQYTQIKKSFEDSRIILKHRHKNVTFSLLVYKVSVGALDILTEELKRIKEINEYNLTCGCIIRTTCGLPCACEISTYVENNIPIPLQSIDIFWRTLDFSTALIKNNQPYTYNEPDFVIDEQLAMLKDAYNKQKDPMVQKSWMNKIRSIFEPNNTNFQEPAVKINTRGRPTLKKQQQNKSVLSTAQPPIQRTQSHLPGRKSSYVDRRTKPTMSELALQRSYSHKQPEQTYDYYADYTPIREPSDHAQMYDFMGQYPNTTKNISPGYDFIGMNHDNFGHGSIQDPYTGPTYDFMGLDQHNIEHGYFPDPTGPSSYDYIGLTQESVNDQKSQNIQPYIDQIPTILRPYCKRIHDVRGDGNCGFRAIASALGYDEDEWKFIRNSLLEELLEFQDKYLSAFSIDFNRVYMSLNWSGEGFAPQEHWMIMPDTGFLIANKFGVVVQYLNTSSHNSSICFPLWRGPDQFPNVKVITIGHVNENHYVMVELQGQYPMAITNNLWTLRRERDAVPWESVFRSRQDIYRNWVTRPSEYVTLE